MKYVIPETSKVVNIPDKEIQNSMKLLEISQEEAIELWLSDNDYTTNAEQQELDDKAKQVKINHGASAENKAGREKKPRIVVISDQKQALFNELKAFFVQYAENTGAKVEVLKENKLFSVQIDEKIIKVDLIEQRKPKN